jgi:hypothetical protein
MSNWRAEKFNRRLARERSVPSKELPTPIKVVVIHSQHHRTKRISRSTQLALDALRAKHGALDVHWVHIDDARQPTEDLKVVFNEATNLNPDVVKADRPHQRDTLIDDRLGR